MFKKEWKPPRRNAVNYRSKTLGIDKTKLPYKEDTFIYKRLADKWSFLDVDSEIVSLFHHCDNGSKGQVGIKYKWTGTTFSPAIVYDVCDLCGADVPEEIRFLLKVHTTKYT